MEHRWEEGYGSGTGPQIKPQQAGKGMETQQQDNPTPGWVATEATGSAWDSVSQPS